MKNVQSVTSKGWKHVAGDGLHLVNNNLVVFEDGTFEEGDSSDVCIVTTAQILCSAFGLPPLWQLWSECFPEDPMDQADLACIIDAALPYMEKPDPLIPDDRFSILADLRNLGCDILADKIEALLKEKGAH